MSNSIVLIGHGSLRSASGAAMIRVAARLRERGVAPIVEASFLNFSRPTFADAVARCVAQGTTKLVVQPYFLISGKYVIEDVPALVAEQQSQHPNLQFVIAEAFGVHPALIELVLARAQQAAPDQAPAEVALLLLAHGSPLAVANAPIEAVATAAAQAGGYVCATVGYMECNEPSITAAINGLVAEGIQQIVAVPYFLQLGRHVRDDLPALITAARRHHPTVGLWLAHHLDDIETLVQVVAERAAA